MNVVPNPVIEHLPAEAIQSLETARDKAFELEKTARRVIQDNPVAAVAGALTLGFVVARLVRR